MSSETPRVIAIKEIDTVTLIDGELTVAMEMRTPDDRAFAVLLGRELAVALRDRLNDVLAKGKPDCVL